MNDFPTFAFNGFNSYKDLGIIVTKMPPIFLSKRDIQSIQIEGSNRILHVDNEAYLLSDVSIECILVDISKLDKLKKTFSEIGEIEFSNNPGRIYRCTIVNQVNFSKYCNSDSIKEFPLQLELEPLAYSKESKVLNIDTSGSFNIDGTENSNPMIKVTGIGTVTLNNISVQFLENNITLDCENMEATTNLISKNDKVILNDFPYLIPGNNTIVLSDGIENVEISYKERWL